MNRKYTEYIVIDLETTGLSPIDDEIIEFGGIHIRDGNEVNRYNFFIKPEKKIPERITKYSGITNEMVAECDVMEKKIKEIYNILQEYPIVGHNCYSFDSLFLKKVYQQYGYKFNNPIIDTFLLADKYKRNFFLTENESLKLENLINRADYLGNNNIKHRSIGDCEQNLKVFLWMLKNLEADGVKWWENSAKDMREDWEINNLLKIQKCTRDEIIHGNKLLRELLTEHYHNKHNIIQKDNQNIEPNDENSLEFYNQMYSEFKRFETVNFQYQDLKVCLLGYVVKNQDERIRINKGFGRFLIIFILKSPRLNANSLNNYDYYLIPNDISNAFLVPHPLSVPFFTIKNILNEEPLCEKNNLKLLDNLLEKTDRIRKNKIIENENKIIREKEKENKRILKEQKEQVKKLKPIITPKTPEEIKLAKSLSVKKWKENNREKYLQGKREYRLRKKAEKRSENV